MRTIYKATVALLLVVVVVLAFQNIGSVTVSLFTWGATVPLAVVVIASYILGMVTGGGVLSLMMRSVYDDPRKSN